MVLDRQVLSYKLSKLKEFIRRIEEMEFTAEKFNADVDIQDLLTFRLVQCVEIAIDIATHIIAALNLPRKETAKEAFLFLGQGGILSKKTALALSKAAGFRNLAAHEYDEATFNVGEVFKDYKNNVKELKLFSAEIVKFTEKKTSKR